MKFSVLIPVYNVKKYIKECLDSVVFQSYSDFEVVIVDDGSTDGSGDICDAYQSQYPERITVFHNINRGLMLSRRFGIQHSRGEILVFVDSDDYVDTHMLERLNEIFESKSPDMVIYGFYRFVDGHNEEKEIIHLPYKGIYTIKTNEEFLEFKKKFVIDHVCTNMWQKAVKRSCVDVDQDYTQWKASRCEDVIQSLPLLDQADEITFLDEPLYYYRKNDAAMTATERPENLPDYVMCMKRSMYYLDRWFQDESVKQFYRARQNLFYYGYLRNVYKRIKCTSDAKEVMCELSADMFEQEVIRDIFHEHRQLLRLLPKRVHLRIRLFDFFMQHQAWIWVYFLIKCNTFFERI